MHDTSDKYLLQIHPTSTRSERPVDDELTAKMKTLLDSAKIGTQWRGWHNCTGCNTIGGSSDLIVGPYITNSLAVHYLRWHRGDVPYSEIEKLIQL